MIWQAYYILDELVIAGELQESSKKTVARLIAAQVLFIHTWCISQVTMQYSSLILKLDPVNNLQDSLVEAAKEEASSISNIIAQATKWEYGGGVQVFLSAFTFFRFSFVAVIQLCYDIISSFDAIASGFSFNFVVKK